MKVISFHPIKLGIRIGLILFLLIPVILFVLTQYFWHYFFPIVPTYPSMIYPKYTGSGDSLFELVNLGALATSLIGFLILTASLRPQKSATLGLIIGLAIYLLFGFLVVSFTFNQITFPNSLMAIVIWPMIVCNCWLY